MDKKINFIKPSLRIVIIVSLILVLAVGGFTYYKWKSRIIPEELIKETLIKTLEEESYRYDLYCELLVDNKKRILSEIKGEQSGKQFQIKGEMLKTKVEIRQLDNVLYMKDSMSGRWIERPGDNILNNEFFLVEMSPLSTLKFVNVTNLEYLGTKKTDNKKKFHILKCTANIDNAMLNKFWKDFNFEFLIDTKTLKITNSQVVAIHKQNPKTKMLLKINFYDFGKKIIIANPKQEKS